MCVSVCVVQEAKMRRFAKKKKDFRKARFLDNYPKDL